MASAILGKQILDSNLEVDMSRVVHFEIPADDPERSIKFYETVFGWTIEKWDGPIEYWLIITGDEDKPGIDGGLARREDPETGVENTIDVKNLDQTLADVKANGERSCDPEWQFPVWVGWHTLKTRKAIHLV